MPGVPYADLIGTMNVLNGQFDYGERNDDPSFWLSVLQLQLQEARGHQRDGLRGKVLNEIADCVLVAWTALAKLGEEPEAFIMRRIQERIIRDIPAIIRKNSDMVGKMKGAPEEA